MKMSELRYCEICTEKNTCKEICWKCNETSERMHTLLVHEKANLEIEDFDEKLLLKLTNKINGNYCEKYYYKIGHINMKEINKIDNILFHMHYEIGLDLWENNN